jgi:diacylglycerol kinase (ATP)
MTRYLIILNPTAGNGTARQMIPQIRSQLQSRGVNFEIVLTERPKHALELAAAASEQGYDVVVGAGGDGTVNEVLNGLMAARKNGSSRAVKMGVLPIGRGNDFAFGTGIPLDCVQSCQVLADGTSRPVDIGRITGGLYPEGRYFGNGVGIGFDAVVSFVHARSNIRGHLGYLVAALKTIYVHFAAPLTRIIFDGQTITQPSLMVSIMNGRRMGGGFMMAPEGIPDDGLFDLCIAHEVRKSVILQMIPRFMRGTQAGHPAIRFERAQSIEVFAEKGNLPAHADGEVISVESDHLKIEMLPGEIDLLSRR